MKRKTSLLLLLLAIATAASAHDFVANGMYFNITSTSTVAVTYQGDYPNGHYSGAVVVPQTIDYQGTTYRVTAVTDYAFANCPSLQSVELPVGVETIGLSSFMQSTSLSRVVLPAGLKEIGMWAFQGCQSLQRIVIPEGVETLGEGALMQNPMLRYVNLPSTLHEIVQQQFYGNQALDTLVLHTEEPPAVTGNAQFYNVPSSLHVIVPCGALEAYQGEPWSGFQVEENCGGIPTTPSSTLHAPLYYDLTGRPLGSSLQGQPTGLYLERRGLQCKKVYHLNK